MSSLVDPTVYVPVITTCSPDCDEDLAAALSSDRAPEWVDAAASGFETGVCDPQPAARIATAARPAGASERISTSSPWVRISSHEPPYRRAQVHRRPTERWSAS